MTWSISLVELTDAEIAEAAAEHFLIKIRRTFAKVEKPTDDDWDHKTFDANDFKSTRISKAEKLVKTLADFTDEELAALGLVRAVEDAQE